MLRAHLAAQCYRSEGSTDLFESLSPGCVLEMCRCVSMRRHRVPKCTIRNAYHVKEAAGRNAGAREASVSPGEPLQVQTAKHSRSMCFLSFQGPAVSHRKAIRSLLYTVGPQLQRLGQVVLRGRDVHLASRLKSCMEVPVTRMMRRLPRQLAPPQWRVIIACWVPGGR